ncbi:beta strand repeat-containing protein [Bifidobacterium panos]|uniref:Nuclease n=1 Tax=Bifidobacterium panos TaxID=2675321 RepID=A0ABX1SXK1_9BIFI|nr:hypothetical protein [Bifidobacterium sp. DSM 109963]NMN02581.1 nuclease [Bifidobacterium sp. DSM 109963]
MLRNVESRGLALGKRRPAGAVMATLLMCLASAVGAFLVLGVAGAQDAYAADAVCQVTSSGSKYDTLQGCVDAAAETDTVTMLVDAYAVPSTVMVPAGKSITVLPKEGGTKLSPAAAFTASTSMLTVESGAGLQVNDGVGSDAFSNLDIDLTSGAYISVADGGTAAFNGCTITYADAASYITSAGTLALNGCTLEGNRASSNNRNQPAVKITGGTVMATNTNAANFYNASGTGGVYGLDGGADLTIDGGTYQNNYSVSSSNLTDDGSVIGGSVALVKGGATVNLQDGTITGNNSPSDSVSSTQWGNAPFTVVNGTFNMTGGTITANQSSFGPITTSTNPSNVVTISGGSITGNTAYYDGGAIFMFGGRLDVNGTAKITNNSAGRCSGAIELRGYNTSDVAYIGGNAEITGNTSCTRETTRTSGALGSLSTTTMSIVHLSGSPNISGNTCNSKPADLEVQVSAANYIVDSDLGDNAKIGIYPNPAATFGAAGKTFAVSSAASSGTVKNLDKFFLDGSSYYGWSNEAYAASATSQDIVWGSEPVCQVQSKKDTSPGYGKYDTLQKCVDNSDATDTVTMLVDTYAVPSTVTVTGKSIVLMPKEGGTKLSPATAFTASTSMFTVASGAGLQVNDGVGSDAFSNLDIDLTRGAYISVASGGTAAFNGCTITYANAASYITSAGDLTLNGCTLEGNRSTITRTQPAVKITGGTATATNTSAANFNNSSGTGGVYRVEGAANLTINGGTYENNYSASTNSATPNMGGSVMFITGGSTVTLQDGTLTNNGAYEANTYANSAVYIQTGTFNMTGGSLTGNKGSHGGAISAWNYAGNTINISGGTISDNQAWYDGGAIYVSETASNTLIVSENAKISGNSAKRNGGAISQRGGTLTISGNAVITGNNVTGAIAQSNPYYGAISSLNAMPTVHLSGSPQIYGNTYGTTAADLEVRTSAANYIVDDDLGDDAKIGIYAYPAATYGVAGATFAKSAATSSLTVKNLDKFFLDGSSYVGWAKAAYVGSGTYQDVVWGGEPVCLVESLKSTSPTYGKYDTLQKCVTASAATDTVTMLVDAYAVPSTVTVPAGKSVVLLPKEGGTKLSLASTFTAGTSMLSVASGATLQLNNAGAEDRLTLDGSATTNNKGINSSGTLNVGSTTIQNFTYSAAANQGGAAILCSGATKLMNGATITDNTVSSDTGWGGAGGIGVNGNNASLLIEDGAKVTRNAGYDGGGISVANGASVTMSGGEISDNYARNPAGGVYLYSTGGSFTMTGGTITGNYSKNYGGGAIFAHTNSTVKLSGGTITGNSSAAGMRGAVEIYTSTSKLEVSGSPVVWGNYVGGTWDATNKKISALGTVQKDLDNTGNNTQAYITVTGDLDAAAKLGVRNAVAAGQPAGAQFGTTSASSALTVKNLSAFKNLDNTNLFGAAGANNQTIWAGYGDVRVYKGTSNNYSDKQHLFEFTLGLPADTTQLAGQVYDASGAATDRSYTFTASDNTFELRDGEYLVIEKVPSAWAITVTESDSRAVTGEPANSQQYKATETVTAPTGSTYTAANLHAVAASKQVTGTVVPTYTYDADTDIYSADETKFNRADFGNVTLDEVPATGVQATDMQYRAMALAAGLALALLAVARLRRHSRA